MIDTIRLEPLGTWKPAVEMPPGWSLSEQLDVSDLEAGCSTPRRFLHHKKSGLRMSGFSGVQWVEVSLPRLLHGHNGRLLATPRELAESFDALHDLMAEVVQLPRRGTVETDVKRVDTVWQHNANPEDFIDSHRSVRHPRIRAATKEFFGQSLHFAGKDLHGRIYDKGLEANGKRSNVTRVEWQQRGGTMRSLWTGNRKAPLTLKQVTFERSYQIHRGLCLGWCPRPLAQFSSVAQFLSFLEEEGFRDSYGRTALQAFSAGKSRTTRYRWAKKVAAASIDYWAWDWDHQLPQDFPPQAVNYSPEEAAA